MLTLKYPIELQRPSIVRFGAGQVETLAAWLDATGARRPFVVADKVNAARLDVLGLRDAALFGEVKPEPDLPNLEAAVAGGEGGRDRRGHRLRRRQRHGSRQARRGAGRPATSGCRTSPARTATPARRVAARPDPDDRRDGQRGRDAGADHRPRDDEQDRNRERRDARRHRDHRPRADGQRAADGDGRDRRRRDGALRRGLHLEAGASDHRLLRAAGDRARRPLSRAARSATAATSRPAPGWRSPPSTAASASARSTPPPAMHSPIRSAPATSSPTASPTR